MKLSRPIRLALAPPDVPGDSNSYWIVTVIGTLFVTVPDVADTRTVFVPVSCGGLLELPLPPQPIIPTRITSARLQSTFTATARLPTTDTDSSASSNDNIPRPFKLPNPEDAAALELIVIELVALLPSVNVTCEGLNWQFIPMGRPEQANDTAPVSPDRDVTCSLIADDVAPYDTCSVFADAVSCMSPLGLTTTIAGLDVELSKGSWRT